MRHIDPKKPDPMKTLTTLFMLGMTFDERQDERDEARMDQAAEERDVDIYWNGEDDDGE